MVPHVFGWFTMTSVWFILVVQLENAKRDLDEVSDRKMPEWVDAVVRTNTAPTAAESSLLSVLRLASGRSTAPF